MLTKLLQFLWNFNFIKNIPTELSTESLDFKEDFEYLYNSVTFANSVNKLHN